MEKSRLLPKSIRKKNSFQGFTMMEVVIAAAVLTIGLLATAALLARTFSTTNNSRYISLAATLASEKLDELARLPGQQYSPPTAGNPITIDNAIYAPDGGSNGDLNNKASQAVTVGAVTENVDYWDEVQVSSGEGVIAEQTVSSTNAAGAKTFTTVTQGANGSFKTVTSTTAPTPSPDTLFFDRFWKIEKDPAGLPPGVRRITVVVRLTNPGLPNVTFESSMVRP